MSAASAHVIDVTASTFEAEVLETSKRIPVIVDFWAPWCAPCRALGPVLEKLANEYGGRFRLAKVNSDENLEISQLFGVRSIPDVRAFRDGEQVDQFMGALPESQIRAFIERVVPSPSELHRLRAAALRTAGDRAAAVAALREALTLDDGNGLARMDLAEILLDLGEPDEAGRQLDQVRFDVDWESRIESLRQAIAFARSGGNEQELTARVAGNPDDLDARLALAAALAARKSWGDALEQLLEVVRRNKNYRDGEARKQMVAIFTLAGDQPDVVSDYRRKLARALY